MDTVKIGRFIAVLRKEKNLTQSQLGEKIGVTNKTVSRWENGNYLPSVDMLKILSEEFSVSINEILNGERLNDEDYKTAAEKNLTDALRSSTFALSERKIYWKKKYLKENLLMRVIFNLIIISVLTFFLLICLELESNIYVVLIDYIYAFAAFIFEKNKMMAYVEKKAY